MLPGPLQTTVRTCRIALLALLLMAPAAAETSKNGFDLDEALVPAREIFWGGVSKNGIPALHAPKFVDAVDARFLSDKSRVLGVLRNGRAKAYPIRIMDRHEVVNDSFAGEPIVVTYCPLCFSGMAFTFAGLDTPLTFGVSGLLYNSDVLLYDLQTESLFSQILAKAISGPLKGLAIEPIPTAHTTWRDWRSRHPTTQVLSTDTGYGFNYRKSAYRDYYRSDRLMFPVRNRSRAYDNKEPVLGIRIGERAKAYPFEELRKAGTDSFADSLAGTSYRVEWLPDEQYARIVTTDGDELPTVIVYWFAWYAFHPETEVFEADGRSR